MLKTNQTEYNIWDKVYWFARMLINSDKYGSIGKESTLLTRISSSIRVIAHENPQEDESTILFLQKKTLTNILEDRFKNANTRIQRIRLFTSDIEKQIQNISDMNVFLLTLEHVMVPLNNAIENIPSDDKEFTESIAHAYLDQKGEHGLASIIKLWDDLGTKGSLTAERTEIVKAFATLRVVLEQNKDIQGDNDKDRILTAFVQEFERRAAQKRKGRAGGSLEDVTTFILRYFEIPSTDAPDHFQADIEIDNWVKTKDGWLIGISCKRTLRERWKQVSSAAGSVLSQFKIKNLYHIITYDEDLSDEKITLLGGQRHMFYLPDNSRVLIRAQEHVGMKDYVRPISQIISDIMNQL